MIRQNCARWFFLFGVLAGLFFSGGEGIQLLPFPAVEGRRSEITFSEREENSRSYAFSVFSSRNYSALLKSKFQKYTGQYLTGACLTFDRSETCADVRLRSAERREAADLRHPSTARSSRSDRAPPAI
jgi:hypothetical protein